MFFGQSLLKLQHFSGARGDEAKVGALTAA